MERVHQRFRKHEERSQKRAPRVTSLIHCDLGRECGADFPKQIISSFQSYLLWSRSLCDLKRQNRDVDFPRLVLPLSTALWFLTAICLGDISAESKVELSVLHPSQKPHGALLHPNLIYMDRLISQIIIFNWHPWLKKKQKISIFIGGKCPQYPTHSFSAFQ